MGSRNLRGIVRSCCHHTCPQHGKLKLELGLPREVRTGDVSQGDVMEEDVRETFLREGFVAPVQVLDAEEAAGVLAGYRTFVAR